MQTGRHFLSSCSEVNSTGYPEFDEPISTRHQRYPHILNIALRCVGYFTTSPFSCKSNACFARGLVLKQRLRVTRKWLSLCLHDPRRFPPFQTWRTRGQNSRYLRLETYVTKRDHLPRKHLSCYVTEDAWWLAVFVTKVCPDST